MIQGAQGFPGGSAGKESACNVRSGFDPWVGKIPRRRERLPTLVFLPGEFHGLCSPWHRKESDRTERLQFHFYFSHSSKVMLKILQARPQQYVNCEVPDV